MKGGVNSVNQIQTFGMPKAYCRTENGSLLTQEIEKINQFLFRRGMLIVDYYGSYLFIMHPGLIRDLDKEYRNVGISPIILAASLPALRQSMKLTIAENRVLEALTPGPIILARDEEYEYVSIPERSDLRDLCSAYNGVLQGYLWTPKEGKQLQDILLEMDCKQYGINQMATLEEPTKNQEVYETASIVRVFNPGNIQTVIEGAYNQQLIEEASQTVCLWEMGEWT